MNSKITILLLLFWTASCNARRIAGKPHEEKKDVAEKLFGNAEFEEEYDDVMDGLTEKPPDDEVRRPLPENDEDDGDDTEKSVEDKSVPEEDSYTRGREGKNKKDGKSHSLRDYSFYNLGEISGYIQQIRRAMEKAFRHTVEGALDANGTYVNDTEDEVEMKGHKYRVHKSIIQARDNDSTVLIEAIESDAVPDRKKRSNWFAEEADNGKSTDP